MPVSDKKNTISLCMIVRNEEQTLPDCLHSASDLVDEIIIVDTGSTDSTVSIAEGFGAKTFSFEWIDDFSAARNFSLTKAVCDWILVLDADEILEKDSADRIREVVNSGEAMAYLLNFISNVRESSAGKELVHSHPRLFRNGHGILYKGRIHEQIVESVSRAGGDILPTDIYVSHTGYSENKMSAGKKIDRNILILQKEIEQEPENGIAYFYLGENFSMAENWNEAINNYRKCAEYNNIPPLNRALLYQNLGSAYFNNGEYENSLKYERKSLEIEPDRITPRIVAAESAMTMKNYDLAVWEWSGILDRSGKAEPGVFQLLSDFLPDPVFIKRRLAEAYYLSKDYSNAAAVCKSIKKESEDAGLLLAQIYFADGDFISSKSVLKEQLDKDQENTEALLLLAKTEANLENFSSSEAYFGAVLEKFPENNEARVGIETIKAGKNRAAEIREQKKGIGDNELNEVKAEAETLLRNGRIKEAYKLLKPLVDSMTDFDLFFLMAFTENSSGNFKNARDYCKKAVNIRSDDAKANYLLGSAYLSLEEYKNAIVSFSNAVRSMPGMFEAWSGIGVAAVKLQDFTKAKEAFEQAHKLNPEDMQMKKNLAAVCGILGLTREAEKYLLMTKM